jgi:CysZ protein
MISRFFAGMRFFGRGFKMAFGRGELVPFVLAPGFVAVLLTSGGSWWVKRALEQFFARHSPHHGAFVGVLIWLAVAILTFAIGYLLYNVSCLVATAPFAGVLAERTHHLATGEAIPAQGFWQAVSSQSRGAWHAMLGVFLYVAFAAPLFVVQWLILPVAPIIWVLGLVQTALFFAFDAFNEPLHRERQSFGGKWKFVFDHGAESLGFGTAVALCMMLPLVSLIVTPVSIVGGALLYVELRAKRAT